MNKKPPELHLIDGTKPYHNVKNASKPALIPENIKKRIPKAYWLDVPESFDKNRFISETSEFLHEVYGIGCEQDQHALAVLADHVEVYCQCSILLKSKAVIVPFNDGKTWGTHPALSLRMKTATLMFQAMNELGLTPRSRLSGQKTGDDSAVAKFMRGPKG